MGLRVDRVGDRPHGAVAKRHEAAGGVGAAEGEGVGEAGVILAGREGDSCGGVVKRDPVVVVVEARVEVFVVGRVGPVVVVVWIQVLLAEKVGGGGAVGMSAMGVALWKNDTQLATVLLSGQR